MGLFFDDLLVLSQSSQIDDDVRAKIARHSEWKSINSFSIVIVVRIRWLSRTTLSRSLLDPALNSDPRFFYPLICHPFPRVMFQNNSTRAHARPPDTRANCSKSFRSISLVRRFLHRVYEVAAAYDRRRTRAASAVSRFTQMKIYSSPVKLHYRANLNSLQHHHRNRE